MSTTFSKTIRHKSPLLVALLACGSFTSIAQQQQFTMEEAVLGLRTNLAPDNIKQFNWIPNSNNFTQVVGSKDQSFLVNQSATNAKKVDTLISLNTLNQVLFQKDSLKAMPAHSWSNNNLVVMLPNNYYILERNNTIWSKKATQTLPKGAANIQHDKNYQQYAFTIDNNLYLLDAYGKVHQITNATDLNIISGQSVHRNEFGINGGIFISPKGNQIAFYTMDQTMVADYPIVNWSKTPAVVENIKYPMAGRTSHQVKLGVYNIQSQKTTYLNIAGPKDQYLTSVTWSPDEKYIYVGVLSRNQKHLALNQYNANTGQFVKTLFEEKSDTYVEPQHPLYFINNNEFVWWSQRDGYMHLYRYNTDGKLLNQITKGDWLVNGIYKIDASNKNIYFSATKADAREKHTYVVNYTNGKITALDQEAGMHTAVFNDQNYFVDIFQNAENPRTINIKNASGKQVRPLLKAENKLAKYDQANVEMVTLQAEDGTPLYGKLITPADMDPNKKYPVIVYLYNGPHLQLITNGYPATGNLWYDYLAQNGYVVFTMDGRGSSNRGHKFESATYEQLGQVEMKDQLVGVDYLKTLPFVDASRMGVHGWSYGGFMTTSLMTQYPEVFKVGVAGGPVIDWNMYEIMYTERYMNHPEQNPEGYKQTNLLDKSDKLQGKLLMIHGADDDVVIWQHSLNFIENSVKAGKQVDYYVYPGHKHNVLGKDRVHLMQKITDYFDANLK